MTQQLYDTTVRFLDPRGVQVSKDGFGKLHLEIGEEQYVGIRLTRAFPHTSPDLYLSVADAEGKEIGVIENLAELDEQSRQVLEDELSLVYFSPIIRRILKVVQHYGASSWHVETDHGTQVVRVRERGDIRWLSPHELVITDVHGVRYEVPDVSALDEESRSLLEQET